MHPSLIKSFFTSVLVISFLALSAQVNHVLPTSELVMKAGIATVEIYQNVQPSLEGWQTAATDSTPDDPADQQLVFTYYFSAFGQIDSMKIANDGPEVIGSFLRYDAQHRRVSLRYVSLKRPDHQKQKMWQTDTGWVFRSWEDGKVIRTAIMTKDSVILSDSAIASGTTSLYTYNPKKEEFISRDYRFGKLCAEHYERWLMKEGMPDSLIVWSHYYCDKIPRLTQFRKLGRYEGRHKVHESGSVLTFPESPFSESLEGVKFSARLNKHPGILLWFDRFMVSDALIDRGQTTYTHSFANETKRAFTSYRYTYR